MTEQQTGAVTVEQVSGFPLALDRHYQPVDHTWVVLTGTGAARIGMDALGVETSGTLAQLAFVPVGTALRRGEPMGSLEGAKFVGPLTCPLSGVVFRHNDAVVADPGIVERDPYGTGWLVEVTPSALDGELGALLRDESVLVEWFTDAVADYRARGMVAE